MRRQGAAILGCLLSLSGAAANASLITSSNGPPMPPSSDQYMMTYSEVKDSLEHIISRLEGFSWLVESEWQQRLQGVFSMAEWMVWMTDLSMRYIIIPSETERKTNTLSLTPAPTPPPQDDPSTTSLPPDIPTLISDPLPFPPTTHPPRFGFLYTIDIPVGGIGFIDMIDARLMLPTIFFCDTCPDMLRFTSPGIEHGTIDLGDSITIHQTVGMMQQVGHIASASPGMPGLLAVPEPSSMVFFSLGALLLYRIRRQQ